MRTAEGGGGGGSNGVSCNGGGGSRGMMFSIERGSFLFLEERL